MLPSTARPYTSGSRWKFALMVIVHTLLLLPLGQAQTQQFTVTSQVYMDFEHDGQHIGRTTIGLFGDVAPKTVANFRQLCIGGIDGKRYVGTPMHRIINKFVVQGGDIVSGDGRGSISIYGEYFADEHLAINHTGPGFLAMANRGADTNGCQFYITTMSAPWLDGKHTIFGKVVKGQGYVHTVERVETDTDDVPVKPVIITACGDEPISEPFTISDNIYDLRGWITASAFPLGMSFTILTVFHIFIKKLDKFIKEKEE